MKELLIYLGAVNVLAYLVFVADKYLAKAHKQRIKEKTLILFSLMGGFLGAFLAMKQVRHKTQKVEFKVRYFIATFISIVLIGTYIYMQVTNTNLITLFQGI